MTNALAYPGKASLIKKNFIVLAGLLCFVQYFGDNLVFVFPQLVRRQINPEANVIRLYLGIY